MAARLPLIPYTSSVCIEWAEIRLLVEINCHNKMGVENRYERYACSSAERLSLLHLIWGASIAKRLFASKICLRAVIERNSVSGVFTLAYEIVVRGDLGNVW